MLLQQLFPLRVQLTIAVTFPRGKFAGFEGSGGLKTGFQLEIMRGRIAVSFGSVTKAVTLCWGLNDSIHKYLS